MDDEQRGPGRTIRCASPTCADWVAVSHSAPDVLLSAFLERFGWRQEAQPGDDRPLWYCPRCQL